MSAARVAAIGGGHGLACVLAALRAQHEQPVAVVTVADDGGSSGRLRRDLGIIAPGDLRQALIALARDDALSALFSHRFARGELEGHALGNLALVALAERAGEDFVAALDAAGKLLDCAGRVLPTTTEPVELCARVAGREVDGQARVTHADGRIERVWLAPEGPSACPEAVESLRAASTIVLGPGSLFTSVVAALLVPGIRKAVQASDATIVYVTNVTTQVGESAGFDVADHVDALLAHVPGLRLDAVIVHDGPVADGAEAVTGVPRRGSAGTVVRADVVARDEVGRPTWGHDPDRLGAALAPFLP